MLLDETYALEAPTDDAIRFTFAFARLEYALKSAGFFSAGRSGEVKANWDRFAGSISDLESTAKGDLADAISYLYQRPPMAERVRNGVIRFEPAIPAVHSNVELFLIIRRIRNNLFHGGKVPYRQRDEQLVQCSLSILRAIVERHAVIAAHFA